MLKKDNKLYLYINYKDLNIITLKNRYLLPLIIKILDYLNNFKIFIKLDLKDTYYNIYIKKGNKQKIIFYTYYNYFKYLIIPFRLINIIYIIYLDNIYYSYYQRLYILVYYLT